MTVPDWAMVLVISEVSKITLPYFLSSEIYSKSPNSKIKTFFPEINLFTSGIYFFAFPILRAHELKTRRRHKQHHYYRLVDMGSL